MRATILSIASRHHKRKSVETWSFRLRAVWSFLAGSPILSVSAASMFMCTSSLSVLQTNSPFSMLLSISSRPWRILSLSLILINPYNIMTHMTTHCLWILNFYNKNRTCTIFVPKKKKKSKILTLRLNQVSVLHVNHLTHSKNHNSSFPLIFPFSIKHFLRKQTDSKYNRTCNIKTHITTHCTTKIEHALYLYKN